MLPHGGEDAGMMPDSVREQHRELRRLAAALARSLDSRRLRSRSEEALSLFSRLSGMLSTHVALERSELYPAFARHPDPEVRDAAAGLMDDAEELLSGFESFKGRWLEPSVVRAEAVRFMQEARGVCYELATSMEREDRQLNALISRARPAA